MPVPTIHDLTAHLSPRAKYLVGVSGGADSVALLHLLLDAGFRHLVVCHVDHQLRGAASRADARFVEKLCKKYELTFCSKRVAVKKLAQQRGESIETTARNLRHEFFAKVARDQRCPRLILAHHADDQAETILWNLLRGSHGAKGMRTEQTIQINGRSLIVLRPLLQTRREELRNYLQERGISWREDVTNAQPVATRNRIRNEALPLLCEIAQRDVTPLLLRQIDAQQDQESLEQWALAQVNALDPQGRLHVPVMQALPPPVQTLILRDYLQQYEITEVSRDLLERCRMLLIDHSTHNVNLPGNSAMRRRAGRITCLKLTKD